MIPKSTIEGILARINLAELIGESVELKATCGKHKCCCPFHGEKTPSFYIYPDGHYHCFGCGAHGNAITYVKEVMNMTFPEAVTWLGNRVGIRVEQHEETPEQRAERMEKEQLYTTNETVYRSYHEEFKKSKEAQDYAYARWGKTFCDEMGLGYAPGGHFLVDRNYHRKSITTLGLINHRDEDFFQNRLIIPIRDRMHRVIAFTARRLDGIDDSKYINSRESPIYKKGDNLFGIDVASRNMGKKDIVYLVEGASDWSRLCSIGIKNTVACLGTAWTDNQLDQLSSLSHNLCFIPDGDIPKVGEKFGPGIKAVLRAGRRAIEKGFRVSVKEIPNNTGEKQDPDTFFKDKQVFSLVNEVDYILWYARYSFEDAVSPSEKSDAVKDVASLLARIEDSTSLDVYISDLKEFGTGKRVWQKAIESERQRIELKNAEAAKESIDEMDKQFGFHIENGKYFSVTDKGSVYEWSNFIMDALFLIRDEDNPVRLFIMRNEYGKQVLISLSPGDLVSLSQFRIKVEQEGNFLWKATEKELIKLKGYLFKNTKDAHPIKQLGWQKEQFFAFGNGVCVDGQFIATDDYGIVRLAGRGIFYLPSNASINRLNNKQYAFEHQFVHKNLSRVTLKEYTDQLFKVYGDNGRVGFAFLLATLFKDIVIAITRSFPMLNLFGPKGSGKSDMGQALMAFHMIENKGLSLTNSTMASLANAVAAVANSLVHLEEYKNYLDPKRIEFLKGLWDGIGRTRMSMDVSGRKETSAVDCGVIVSGQEMPTEDIALFTRLIFLQFPRSEFTIEEKNQHKILMKMASTGLTHLTIQILGYREHVEKHFPAIYDETFDIVSRRLQNEPIEDRILKNWVTPLAVYRTLEMMLDISMQSSELMTICLEGIRRQSKETKTNSELGSFWNTIAYLVSQGELVEDCDFKIKGVRKFISSTIKADWIENRRVLYLQKSKVFMLYKMKARLAGDNVIPEESLKYYLEQSRAFLGEKNMRYYVAINGIKQPIPGTESGRIRYQQNTQRSYCFDYDLLSSLYQLNLQSDMSFRRSTDGYDTDNEDEDNIED